MGRDVKSQIAISPFLSIRSQIATASKRNVRFFPYAFSGHGAIMAANVLNSPEAIRMSVFVVRAFIKMREALISRSELERRLLQIRTSSWPTMRAFGGYDPIRSLLLPPPPPPRKKIGFEVKEAAGRYRKEHKRK